MRPPLLVVIFACGLLTWWLAESSSLHGDLIYFEAFYRDFFMLRNPLREFQFTEATFLFPDFAVMSIVRAAVPSAAWAILLYVFIFLVCFAYITANIFRRIWGGPLFSWSFTASFSLMLLLVGTTQIYVYMAYFPQHHGVIQLLFLLWWWQMLSLRSENYLARWLVADLVCAAGFAFSDLLAVPSVFAPGILILVSYAIEGTLPRKSVKHVVLVTVIGLLSGALIKYDLIQLKILAAAPTDFLATTWEARARSAMAFPPSLLQLLKFNWLLFLTLALLLVLGVWQKKRGRIRQSEAPEWQTTFLTFASLTIMLKVIVLLLTARWPNVYSMRYLQEFQYFPLLWLAFWGVPQLLSSPKSAKALSMAILTVASIYLISVEHKFMLLRQPELSKCLDSHAHRLPTPWGFANFWIARAVTFTSRGQIHVNQLKINTSIYNWESSARWYDEDIYKRPITRTTFFIPSTGKHKAEAIARWGEPEESFECPSAWGTLEVMLYPKGIEPAPEDDSRAD